MMTALTWVKDRAMLIGLASAMAVAVFLFFRLDHVAEKRAEAEASLALTVSLNDKLDTAVSRLEGRIDRLDAISAQRMNAVLAVIAESQSQSEAIEELRESNEAVDDYLRTPIPDDLARLFSASGGDGGAGDRDDDTGELAPGLPSPLPGQ